MKLALLGMLVALSACPTRREPDVTADTHAEPVSVGALIGVCYKSCDTWVRSWQYVEKPLDFHCNCKSSDQIAPLPRAEQPPTGGI